MTNRRNFLTGTTAALITLAAPAVIRTPGLLMPVRQPVTWWNDEWIARYWEIDTMIRPPMVAADWQFRAIAIKPGTLFYVAYDGVRALDPLRA